MLHDRQRTVESALFVALVLLLAWIPVPFGSNVPWAWTLLEVTSFALVSAWCTLWALDRARAPSWLPRAWPAFAALALWLVLQAAHLVPLPMSWVEALSPAAAQAQGTVADLGVVRDRFTLSVDPSASSASLLRSLAYVSIFFLVLVLANRRARIVRLLQVLVGVAVVHAIVAVLLHLDDATVNWFGHYVSHAGSARGGYTNRNHFAGYLEMTLAIGIGLLIAGLSDRRADSWKQFVRHTLEWLLSPKIILRLSLCILVIALTTTHSRMGNTAFFASLLATGVVGVVLSRRATRNTVLLLSSLIVLDLFIVGSWFGVEKLAQRLEKTTATEYREREEPARHTLPMIRDHAWFGSGPGSFYVAFQKYKPETVVGLWDHAHNDYAQFAAESGVLGLGMLGFLVIWTLGVALAAQWQRRDPLMRGISFACAMGVTAILIHSWVDFNLQIPANAAYFMVLLALGWISLYHDRHPTPGIANVRVER
jgi:putative inorganic carbon (HCO3(-)) transporter